MDGQHVSDAIQLMDGIKFLDRAAIRHFTTSNFKHRHRDVATANVSPRLSHDMGCLMFRPGSVMAGLSSSAAGPCPASHELIERGIPHHTRHMFAHVRSGVHFMREASDADTDMISAKIAVSLMRRGISLDKGSIPFPMRWSLTRWFHSKIPGAGRKAHEPSEGGDFSFVVTVCDEGIGGVEHGKRLSPYQSEDSGMLESLPPHAARLHEKLV